MGTSLVLWGINLNWSIWSKNFDLMVGPWKSVDHQTESWGEYKCVCQISPNNFEDILLKISNVSLKSPVLVHTNTNIFGHFFLFILAFCPHINGVLGHWKWSFQKTPCRVKIYSIYVWMCSQGKCVFVSQHQNIHLNHLCLMSDCLLLSVVCCLYIAATFNKHVTRTWIQLLASSSVLNWIHSDL